MLMDTLQQEVEALSAEVTRLRLIVYRVTEAMQVPPQTHEHQQEGVRANHRCHVFHESEQQEQQQQQQQDHKSSESASDRVAASPLAGLPPELLQSIERLVSACRDATASATAIKEGKLDVGQSEKHRRRHRRREHTRSKKKKHRVHTLSSEVSSSSSDSSSSSPSSSLLSEHSSSGTPSSAIVGYRHCRDEKKSHKHSHKKKKEKEALPPKLSHHVDPCAKQEERLGRAATEVDNASSRAVGCTSDLPVRIDSQIVPDVVTQKNYFISDCPNSSIPNCEKPAVSSPSTFLKESQTRRRIDLHSSSESSPKETLYEKDEPAVSLGKPEQLQSLHCDKVKKSMDSQNLKSRSRGSPISLGADKTPEQKEAPSEKSHKNRKDDTYEDVAKKEKKENRKQENQLVENSEEVSSQQKQIGRIVPKADEAGFPLIGSSVLPLSGLESFESAEQLPKMTSNSASPNPLPVRGTFLQRLRGSSDTSSKSDDDAEVCEVNKSGNSGNSAVLSSFTATGVALGHTFKLDSGLLGNVGEAWKSVSRSVPDTEMGDECDMGIQRSSVENDLYFASLNAPRSTTREDTNLNSSSQRGAEMFFKF